MIRLELRYLPGRSIVPNDFRIDVALAHPPGDDLRVLRTEVENEDSRSAGVFTGWAEPDGSGAGERRQTGVSSGKVKGRSCFARE